ncbi:MAG: hypothetical protein ACE5OW_01775 [Candidatus Bathyarchaeia archaeon]
MPNVTISVSKELKEKMDAFREVSWSEVCRRAIANYIEARSSANPIARAKFLELKEKEKAEGYRFGLEIAEETSEELSFQQIYDLLTDIEFVQVEGLIEFPEIMTFLDETTAYLEGLDTKKLLANFEEYATKKGSLHWLIKLASEKEGFHRNYVFLTGIFEAVKEVFRW